MTAIGTNPLRTKLRRADLSANRHHIGGQVRPTTGVIVIPQTLTVPIGSFVND